MKLRHFNVELVTEYAKELVYDDRLGLMLDRQEVIFAEQNQRLHRLRDKVDYAIVDSPLPLSYLYAKINHDDKVVDPWPSLESFRAFVFSVFDTYNNKNFVLPRVVPYQSTGRVHNHTQARSIDGFITDLLVDNDIPFMFLSPAEIVTQDFIDKITYLGS